MQLRPVTTQIKIKKAIEQLEARLLIVQKIDEETDAVLNSMTAEAKVTTN